MLRAVPTGDETDYAPGSPYPFTGPRIALSIWAPWEASKPLYNDRLWSATLAGFVELQAPGACGLAFSGLYDPTTLAGGEPFFACGGGLLEHAAGGLAREHPDRRSQRV